MKKYIRYNNTGKILSLIESNDETLVKNEMLEVKTNVFKKIEKDIEKYEVKNKEVVLKIKKKHEK